MFVIPLGMGKKRLVIDLNDADHAALTHKARAAGSTVANYVRAAVGLPLERQGVKRAEPVSERRKKAKKRV